MNELSYGQKINVPSGIVRSVSFDKIRQGSLSRATQPKQAKQAKVSALCQKIMNKKLLGDQSSPLKRPLESIMSQNNQQSKTALLKKQLDVKEMSECTFKPKINKSSQPQRTLEQFINNQVSYEQNKQDKVSKMRQMILKKIDKQNTFQPKLITDNKTDDSKRTLNNVHDRLFEESTKRQQSKQSSIQQKSIDKSNQLSTKRKIATFSRKGSTDRSEPERSLVSKKHAHSNFDPSQFNFSIPNVEQSSKFTIDSEDAPSSRRESSRTSSSKNHKGLKVTKFMDVQQICERKLSKRQPDEKQTKKSNKNKEILIKKVLRQINYIIVELSITSQNLTYIQMSQILEKMNFVDEQSNLNDRKYLFQIWQMLQGDIYESCPLENLVKIIFSLLGCHEFLLIEAGFQEFFGESEKGKKLMLSQKQSKTIKVSFEELTLNRLNKGEYNQNSLKHKEFPFKPFVSKNSTEMAQKYRQRILQEGSDLINQNVIQCPFPENKAIGHVDLLLLDDKLKQIKIKNKREEIEKQKKKAQDQAMNGQKNKKRESLGVELYEQMGNSRRQHLYELGKHTIRVKNEKNNEFVESGLPKQCTFHPKISKSKESSSRTSKQNSFNLIQPNQIKDYDKSIFRMYEGRRFRQQPQQKKHQTDLNHQSKSKSDDSPLLYLNINMQDCNDIKIPVFQCDNLRTITKKVRTILQLDEVDDERLSETLKAQILPTLEELGLC